jgi:hypothetical protein
LNLRLLALTPALLAAIAVIAIHTPERPPASAAFAVLAPEDPTVGSSERFLVLRRSLAPLAIAEEPERPPDIVTVPTPVPGQAGTVARLTIPRLGVNNPIEDTLVLPGGQMDTPHNGVYGVGFYFAFDQPGHPGNAVFSAHETWNRSRGPFYLLHQARIGDEITVQMADGREFRYEVLSNVRYDVHSIPMHEVV